MNYKKWIFLFLALALIFAANNMLDFNLEKIESPTCKQCKIPFTGERCESCGRQITHLGVFQYDGKQVYFAQFFESYEDYQTYMERGRVFNIVGIPMMIAGVASLIYFFYCVYRDKHKRSQIV